MRTGSRLPSPASRPLGVGLVGFPLALTALLLLAAWLRWQRLELRFNQITFAYAAYFEPYVAALEAGDPGRLFSTFVGLHPPGYSILHALWYEAWGAPGGYHLLSGLFSVAAAAVIGLSARATFGSGAGLAAAALAAVSVYALHYALEVNNYPLLLLVAAALQAAALGWMRRPGRTEGRRWAALAALAMYTHALAAVLVALQAAAFAVVHGRRHARTLAASIGLAGLLCLPLLPPVLRLAGRGSTYHNEAPAWIELWRQVVLGMSSRFGPRQVVALLMVAALVGLVRAAAGRLERPASILLGSSLLAAPVILLLSRAGIAAAHQHPYYLLVLPTFLTLAARGLTPGRAAPPSAGAVAVEGSWPPARLRPGLAVLLVALTSQWCFARAEVAEAARAGKRFDDAPHALRSALDGAGSGDAIWLVAPALYPDDDKRAADPAYGLLPRWSRCRYHQPDDLRFEYVDYQYGQPVRCGALTLYTFTDIYGSSMTRLLTWHRAHHSRVEIVLYDFQAAPDYPVRIEAVLEPFKAEKRQIGTTILYTVGLE